MLPCYFIFLPDVEVSLMIQSLASTHETKNMATLHLLCTRIHSANTSRRNLICIDSYLWLRSSIFWDISQRRVVIPYRRFGTTYRFYLQRSRIVPGLLLKMGPIRCPETSVRKYHCNLRNIPEERR